MPLPGITGGLHSMPVVAGTTVYSTATTHNFVVPFYNTMTITLNGPGGGGGGSWYDAGFPGGTGGTGGTTSVTIPVYGSMVGNGGTGGGTWLSGVTGTPGTASGGNVSNITGNGSAGGNGGVYGSSFGNPGGAGGQAVSTFVLGATANAPIPGTTLVFTVGAGGGGGAGEVFGQTGIVGSATISWS